MRDSAEREIAAVPRGVVASLLDEAAGRAGLRAHEGLAVAALDDVAQVAALEAAAAAAVDTFARDLAVSDEGRSLARLARAELARPACTWLLFVARPAGGDERSRWATVASCAALLERAAGWWGLRARGWCGAPLATGAVTAWLARAAGDWFAAGELVAAVTLAPGAAVATIPPSSAGRSEGAAPLAWVDGAARRALDPAAERARAAGEVPPPFRGEGLRALVCEPGLHGASTELALEGAGYAVERVAPEALVARARDAGAAFALVSVDDAASRAAAVALARRHARDGAEGLAPLLGTTRCGHDDARIVAAREGVLGFMHLPARPFDVARKAAELVAMRRAVDETRRHADALRDAQAALVHAERMASLGWLAASVGHDLRTPLAAIRSNGALALRTLERLAVDEGASPEAQRRALASLVELERTNLHAAERLAEIVEGLKALARPAGAESRAAPVREVLEQVLSLCAHELARARVEARIDEGLPPVGLAPAELMQVAMNLVLNASHALGERGGTIALSATRDGDARAVLLAVRDDGPGIDPVVRERLFCAGVTSRAGQGGSGLGLSIVKRLVDGCGGRIDVDSLPGRGACFRVRLPCAPP